MKKAALLILFTALPCTAHAGPWVQDAGHSYTKLDVRTLLGSRYIDGSGETTSIAGYREITGSLYGEVGLGHNVAGLLSWDMVRAFQLADTGTGFKVRPGDLNLGARWAAWTRGRLTLGLEGWLGVPIASNKAIGPLLNDDGQAVAQLRAGPGVFSLAANTSVGLQWAHVFTSASVGWLQRFGGQDGAFRWRATVGGRWSVMRTSLHLSGWHPVDTGNAPLVENPAALTNGSSYTSTVIEIGVAPSDSFVVGATSQFSLAGLGVRRHARGPVFSVFVSYSR